MTHPLYSLPFEWHDLPVERIVITKGGMIVDVLPFNDDADRVEHATLSLLEADSIEFKIEGKLSLKDLDTLEVTDFEVVESAPGRISGTLGILYGGTGYWTIQITDATWHLDHRDAAPSQLPSQT